MSTRKAQPPFAITTIRLFVRRLTDVFIMPPDLEELRRRLIKRGTETLQQIELRLVNAAREMELWRDYRYTIISKSVEEDLMKFRHIMGAERIRVAEWFWPNQSDERQFQTKTRATVRAKNSAAANKSEIHRARRHRINRGIQIR